MWLRPSARWTLADNGELAEASVAELERRRVLLVEDGNHGEYRPRADEFSADGTAFIRASDMEYGRVLFASASRINDTALARIRKGIGRPGDVLFSHKGTVGKLALAPDEAPPFVCSPQTTFWRTLDTAVLDRRFLYFWMQGDQFREQTDAVKGQTDMADYVSLTDQRRIRVALPPIAEQRAIAEVLGALDDKVELNRQVNHTLEEMASALFKSWFVDFDPIVAKADGRRPFGMDAATAAVFPAAFEPGDEGDYPLGWRWVSLADITDKIGSGATPTGGASVYQDAGVSLIRSQNVYDFQFICDGLAHIGDVHAKALAGVTVLPKDVLINITGASFLRTCVVDPGVLPARVNQHVAIVRAAKGVPPHFLHLNLVRPWMKEFLAGHDAGGSRQAITKAHLEGVPILLPSAGVLDTFARHTTPWFELIEANTRESRTLTALRDTLLPKLLSGEVRVKQAPRLVEAAL